MDYYYARYQESRNLLSIVIDMPFWDQHVSVCDDHAAEVNTNQQTNLYLLYKKAVGVLKEDEYIPWDSLYPYERPVERCRLPSYFSIVPIQSRIKYPEKKTRLYPLPHSNLEPDVAAQSLKEIVIRLNEAVGTTQNNDVWKEEFLGAVLLCLELWKAIISKASTQESLNETFAFVVKNAQNVLLSLEILIEILIHQYNNTFQREQKPMLLSSGDAIAATTSFFNYDSNENTLYHSNKALIFNNNLCSSEKMYEENDPLTYAHLSSFFQQCLQNFTTKLVAQPDKNVEANCDAVVEENVIENNFECHIPLPELVPILTESLSSDSQDQTIMKLTDIYKALTDIRDLAEEISIHTYTDAEYFDHVEANLNYSDMQTREAVVDLAKTSKAQTAWWSFSGSSAGLIGGSLLSIGLGPVGIAAGASLGGMLGYKAGRTAQKKHHKKIDKIIQDMTK